MPVFKPTRQKSKEKDIRAKLIMDVVNQFNLANKKHIVVSKALFANKIDLLEITPAKKKVLIGSVLEIKVPEGYLWTFRFRKEYDRYISNMLVEKIHHKFMLSNLQSSILLAKTY